MSRFRFTTAREVFDAFPSAANDMAAMPTGEPPPAFARSLARSNTPEDALTFCAYALPRREAVWWACQCVRELGQMGPGQEDACLGAAEAWVRNPDEEKRRAALRLGMGSDRSAPTPWLALSAAWSGGNVSLVEGGVVPSEPHMTAKAARIAILVALSKVAAKERAKRLTFCVDGGVKLMEHEMAEAS